MAVFLQNLLRSRQLERVEDNLNQGKIWVYSTGTMYQSFQVGICWVAPADGTAVLEVWGAGGSGAEMCCCGFGLPGNAGAYARKTISVTGGQIITGNTGQSCGNADDLCFRGCSQPSGICWNGVDVNGNTTGCLCAQGGKGGVSYCSTGTSGYCCFAGNGFCATRTTGDNCGTICNACPGGWIAQAYGGDVNCEGPISCSHFFGCQPMCPCQFYYSIAVPSNMFSCGNGTRATYRTENDNRHSNWSGQGHYQAVNATAALSKSPSYGIPMSYCWRSDRKCGCYNMQGCMPYRPIGSGGVPPTPCPGVRDHAGRGGHGGIRIRFIES